MRQIRPEYSPVYGKTYSLFGNSDSTSEYFETIRMLADKIQGLNPDTLALIESIRRFSSKKRILKRSLRNTESDNLMSFVMNIIDPYLKKYTENTEDPSQETSRIQTVGPPACYLKGAISPLYA